MEEQEKQDEKQDEKEQEKDKCSTNLGQCHDDTILTHCIYGR